MGDGFGRRWGRWPSWGLTDSPGWEEAGRIADTTRLLARHSWAMVFVP